MATKTWIGDNGGNEGDWSTAANWSASGVPASSDDLMFDGNANYAVESSPGTAADDFDSVTITSDFAYNFGTAAASIVFDASAGSDVLTIDASGCPTYCKIDGGFSATTILNSGSSATACQLDGTFTTLNAAKGTLTFVAGCTVTTLNVNYISAAATDVTITIPTGCTITNVYQKGGIVTCSSAVATRLDLDSGTFTHSDGNTATLSLRGGTYYWNCEGDTITKANLFGGTFDARNNGAAKTITDMDIWPNATAYLNTGGLNITMTNAAKYYGGSLIFDRGSSFQINQ
tara:strand:+ start:1841 stop:2704 length:864 start_codon:yes stop_codon:yes gene_type:complete